MDKKFNSKIIFLKDHKQLFSKKSKNRKTLISKYHKYTVDSYLSYRTNNSNNHSKELYSTMKRNTNTEQIKNKDKQKTNCNQIKKIYSHRKILIKIKQNKIMPENNTKTKKISNNNTNIIKTNTNKKIMEGKNSCFKNKNKKSITFKKLKINVNEISTKNKLNKTYNSKTFIPKKSNIKEIRNINNTDIINRSLGDSSLEINKPKKSENIHFNTIFGRKSIITNICTNNYFGELFNENENYTEENKNDEKLEKKSNCFIFNNIGNNHNNTSSKNDNKKDNDYKKDFLFLNNNSNKIDKNIEEENELDKFFNNNNKNINNNELFRFSNISFYNNNDLYYLNTKNKISIIKNDNLSKNRNSSYFINPKYENIESEENFNVRDFLNDSFEEEILKENQDKKNDNIVSIPCTNCGKMINIDKIDEHSNECYKIKEDIKKEYSTENYISIIDNKIKDFYSYIINIQNDKTYIQNNNIDFVGFLDLILILKQNIEEILNIKAINILSINKLSKINIYLNELMEKYSNSNRLSLLSKIKILLEEKIKYFKEHNENSNKININNNNSKEDKQINNKNKNLRSAMENPIKNKNFNLYHDNSIDEVLSESETMELFDLKKMEKILDEKRELKTDNLENLVNEAKNKRLFMMEVLKVKYQKISNNKLDDLITPDMIWEEAKKQKIQKNEWSKFIFDELNNPNKYLKKIQKRKENKKIKEKAN